VTPRASYRATYYSETTDGTGQVRNLFEFGTEASFKAHKVVSTKSRWYGDGLRHTLQPYVNYTYRPTPNLQPTNSYTGASSEIWRFDDIDDLDETNEITFGFRNMLQTRQNGRTRKFMDLDLYSTLDLETETDEESLDTLNADLEFWFTDKINAEIDTEYDLYDNEYDPFNARIAIRGDDGSSFSTEYRVREDYNNLILTKATLWPKSRYSADASIRYDLDDHEFDDSSLVLKRKLDCIGVGLGFRHTDDDEQIFLYMWILALGENAIP
jgi:hypothetical protein